MTTETVRYRTFDPLKEEPTPIFRLFELVYGDSAAIRNRWEWEFLQNPRSREIRMLTAESDGELVAMTVRMPFVLRTDRGDEPAYFATNSMTAPHWRGKGVIRRLYDMAAEDGALHFSKGTAPAMYRQLLGMGYREIVPNTYMTCLLSPLRWVAAKAGCSWRQSEPRQPAVFADFADFAPVEHFEAPFNAPACFGTLPGPVRDVSYLAWRYHQIPHRRYQLFCRLLDGRMISFLVLRIEGMTARIVDISWDGSRQDEPARTLRFAKCFARTAGAVKLILWGTSEKLRSAASRAMFLKRAETPHFSYRPGTSGAGTPTWPGIHFVHGDGDVEYL